MKTFTIFFKRANLFLFIFILSKYSTEKKSSVASGIRARIFGVDGKDAKQSTTTTAQLQIIYSCVNSRQNCFCWIGSWGQFF